MINRWFAVIMLTLALVKSASALGIDSVFNKEKEYIVESASILWDGGSLLMKLISVEGSETVNVTFKTSPVDNLLKDRIIISTKEIKSLVLDNDSSQYLYQILSKSKIKRRALNDILLYLKEDSKSEIAFSMVYNVLASICDANLISKSRICKITSIERKNMLDDLNEKLKTCQKIL